MKNLKFLTKGFFLLMITVSFTQCEKDDNTNNENSSANHKVYINGEVLNITETSMYRNDDLYDNTLSYTAYCTDGPKRVSFSIEPPSLDSIDGKYEIKIGMSTYNLDYNSIVYSIIDYGSGDIEQRSSRLSSNVTVESLGNNTYKFDLDLKFNVDETSIDSISGFFTTSLDNSLSN